MRNKSKLIKENLLNERDILDYDEDITLDSVYDELSPEQQTYIDTILDNGATIKGLYEDKWYKNGGWNGMMDAIDELENLRNIKQPNFDNLDLPGDIDIWQLIMHEL